MSDDSPGTHQVRAALRYLYGAVSALLHEDSDAMDVLLGQSLLEVPLGDLLDAGALSVAEQLRDIADVRRLRPATLVRVLNEAHLEMAGAPDLFTVLLDGSATYLASGAELWEVEALCQLAACPTETLQALTRLLAAAVTWHARDVGADPLRLVEHVCFGLAVRDAGLSVA